MSWCFCWLATCTHCVPIFYIVHILKGYGKKGFRLDSRLPITLPILNRIIKASPHIYGSQYQICQFKAMCSIAFFSFLRIGEITITSSYNQPLQIDQLSHIYGESNHVAGIKLTFQNFKHNYNRRPFSIELYRQTTSQGAFHVNSTPEIRRLLLVPPPTTDCAIQSLRLL